MTNPRAESARSSGRWRNLASFAYFSFLLLWLVMAFAELVKLGLDHESFFVLAQGKPYISDFVIYYMAALLAWSPAGAMAYDPGLQLEWINRLISPGHIDQVFYMQYPPYAFALLSPLRILPMSLAYWAWCLTGAACAGLAIWHLLNKVRAHWNPREKMVFLLGMYASLPAFLTLRMGQFSFLLLSLSAFVYLGLYERRDKVAGLALSLASIKLQYSLFLALPFLVVGRFRALAWAVFCEALLVASGGLALGWANTWNYPQVLAHAETASGITGVAAVDMVNVRGLASTMMPSLSPMPVVLLCLVLGIGFVSFLWQRSRNNDQVFPWAFSSTIVACLTLSPHAHMQDLLLLTVPAALTLPSVSLFDVAGPSAAHRWWCRLLILYPLIGWSIFLSKPFWALFPVQPFALVNLALLVLASRCLLEAMSAPAPEISA